MLCVGQLGLRIRQGRVGGHAETNDLPPFYMPLSKVVKTAVLNEMATQWSDQNANRGFFADCYRLQICNEINSPPPYIITEKVAALKCQMSQRYRDILVEAGLKVGVLILFEKNGEKRGRTG